MMTIRYLAIGVLIVLTLLLVYANKPLAKTLIEAQARFWDSAAQKFASLRAFEWTAGETARAVTSPALYTIAVLCLIGAFLIYQLPPVEIPHAKFAPLPLTRGRPGG